MTERMKRINECYTRAYISQHYEDWDDRFLAGYDLDSMIATMDEVNPDYLLITARTHNGKWMCDVGWGNMHRSLQGKDQLQGFIDHYHSKGKPVIAYFSTVYDKQIYDDHPDWRQIDVNGKPVREKERFGKVACLNSPYRELLIEMVRKLLSTHRLDGVFFDMTHFEAPPCYCDFCARAFRARYDAELPRTEDWDNPTYRRFIQFRLDSNYTFVKELCDAVKAASPDTATSIQYQIMNDNRISGHTLAIGDIPDYLYIDTYLSGGYIKNSVCSKLAASISRNMPEHSLVTRPGTHDDNPHMKTLDHLRHDAFTALASGCAVQLFDVMWADGSLQKPMWERIAQVFREIDDCKPWLGGMAQRSVAVWYSEKTRLWYGRSEAAKRYEANYFGFCRALTEEQIPYLPITALTDVSLEGFEVLVLPNAVCMSDEEAEAVRRFVAGGGGLVCTEKTSLWDESGNVRGDYALADVLGIRHFGDTSTYSRVYQRYEEQCEFAKRLPSDKLATNWGTVQKVELRGAEAAARIVYPFTEPTNSRYVNILVNPAAVDSTWPACTVHAYGKGQAIYFAGAPDTNYLTQSFPELKQLLADAVACAAGRPLKTRLEAPMSVEMTVFERHHGEDDQLVVHLVNTQPELGKTLSNSAFESRHLIQEVLPVYGLKLSARVSKPVKGVRLQPSGQEPEWKAEGDEVTVTIDRLHAHGMVVIDFG